MKTSYRGYNYRVHELSHVMYGWDMLPLFVVPHYFQFIVGVGVGATRN